MRVAILSDLHDNYILWHEKVLPELKKRQVEAMIFLGDMCSPGVAGKVAEEFALPIHLIWGNVDGDKPMSTQKLAQFEQVKIYGNEGEINFDNRRIFFTHYPDRAREIAATGSYDLVAHGHTHQAYQEQVNKTLLINPGTVGGLFFASSFMIYNTKDNKSELIKPN